MSKKKWGPLLWNIIHILSNKYNRNINNDIFKLLFQREITNIIPCKICKKHYNNFIKNNNIFSNNFELNIYEFHNDVNIRLEKSKYKNFDYVKKKYSKLCCKILFKDINNLIDYFEYYEDYKYVDRVKYFKYYILKNKKLIFNCS